MKKSLVLMLVASFIMSVPLIAQSDISNFRFETNKIQINSGGTASLQVKVYIPENHHIYIKKIDTRSFNIITEFSTKEPGWSANCQRFCRLEQRRQLNENL